MDYDLKSDDDSNSVPDLIESVIDFDIEDEQDPDQKINEAIRISSFYDQDLTLLEG